MFRHLIIAIALLPMIAACSKRHEPPASPAAPEPAAMAQAESEVEPAEVSYAQVLQLQGVTFNVMSPNGTPVNTVTGAEVADLNVDGSPEVYVYVKSTDADAKGAVVAYVANNRKSLSTVFLPPLSATPDAVNGYRGRDEFAVLEGVLGRRFPIYDEVGAPTGKTRQLQYKLSAGEAGWHLTLDRMTEF